MSGIPKRRIGDFLAMWSLGTLFGKTIKVDMAFTRESGVLRILVGCLDHTRIPAKERIYIADGFYDITFEVENLVDFEMISEPFRRTAHWTMIETATTVIKTTGTLNKAGMRWILISLPILSQHGKLLNRQRLAQMSTS
jgi:hypothetical protein